MSKKLDLQEVAAAVGGTYVGADVKVTAGAWGLGYDENDYGADIIFDVRFYGEDGEQESDPKVQKRIRKGVVSFISKLTKPFEFGRGEDNGIAALRAMVGWLTDNPGIALRYVKLSDYKRALKQGLVNIKSNVLTNKEWLASWRGSIKRTIANELNKTANVLKQKLEAKPLPTFERPKRDPVFSKSDRSMLEALGFRFKRVGNCWVSLNHTQKGCGDQTAH